MMNHKEIKKYNVSAFDFNKKGGNPAGVVLNADTLSEKEMLVIAGQLGFSETAFIMKSKLADFRLRFFTPVNEVPLCGHATIASFNLLRDMNIISTGEYTQETKAGILKLFIYDTYVLMEQTKPSYHEILRPEELLPCFKNEQDLFLENYPIQIVSTGLKDIIVPIKNLKTLLHTNLHMDAIQKLSEKYNVVGIHAFSLETIENNFAHTRNFAPLYGIDEESATGTANGALASYLKKYQGHACPNHLVFEQGDHMNSPSRIQVQLTMKDKEIEKVYVGGSARLI